MPAAIEIGVDLFVLAALIVLIGLSKGLQYSLVGMLKWLASAVRHVPVIGGTLAGHIDDAAHWLYNQLGVGILALERSVVFFWHNLAELAIFLGEQIKGLAYDLLWLYHHVGHYLIPEWQTRLLRWLVSHMAALLHQPLRYLRHALTEIVHDAHAVGRAIAHAPGLAVEVPAWVGKKFGEIEREVAGQNRWVRRIVEGLALGSIATGVALKLLERVAPWVRCRNVGNVGRALCRLPIKDLENLLAGVVDVLLIADICRVVSFMTRAARLAVPEIEALSAGVSELIRCQNAERPAALAVAWHDPPPVTNSLALG